MLSSEDALLRLPCDEETYSRQERSSAPFFDNGLLDPALCRPQTAQHVSTGAYFVELVTIWAEVLSHNRRRMWQEAGQYNSEYEEFSRRIAQKLYIWSNKLPPDLQNNSFNIASCGKRGTLSTMVNLHSLYLAINMRLNRNFFHERIPSWSSSHKVMKAKEAADAMLRLSRLALQHETTSTHTATSPLVQLASHSGLMPYLRHAIMLAVDILTAGGSLEPKSLGELIVSLKTVVPFAKGTQQCWYRQSNTKLTVRSRLETMFSIGSSKAAKHCKVWRCRTPLDPASSPDQDIFYCGHQQDPTNSGLGVDTTLFDRLGIVAKMEGIFFLD